MAKRLLAGLAGLTAMGVVYGRYHHDKQKALLTLRAGSQLLNGVEFAMQGEGKPILVLHGGFGDHEQVLAHLQSGRKIEAVKHVRAVTGRSLAAAKAHVDQIEKKNNP